jgi:hypothetical protein
MNYQIYQSCSNSSKKGTADCLTIDKTSIRHIKTAAKIMKACRFSATKEGKTSLSPRKVKASKKIDYVPNAQTIPNQESTIVGNFLAISAQVISPLLA